MSYRLTETRFSGLGQVIVETWPILHVHPMFKNNVNGCHGNYAGFVFIVQTSLSLKTKLLCIFKVPKNNAVML